jgi:hypothetical protein
LLVLLRRRRVLRLSGILLLLILLLLLARLARLSRLGGMQVLVGHLANGPKGRGGTCSQAAAAASGTWLATCLAQELVEAVHSVVRGEG